ncbi:MAG TPA: acylneuraminate cytidylyltransferase family protein [Myxococcota bacterium]
MAWAGRRVLAVVPARGGSKGIPRKNLCKIGGLSLIAHAARTARALPWLDRAVLSTDDEEMAEEGRLHGLAVPFVRPAELASDTANASAMWRHAWLESERCFGERFDVSILLQPTTPLRPPAEVERTVATLIGGSHAAAATVCRVPADFLPDRCLTLGDDGRLRFYLPQGAGVTRRQDAAPLFYRDGTCYARTRASLIEAARDVEEDCAAVVIDHFVVNIDEPFELELAEFVLSRGEAR